METQLMIEIIGIVLVFAWMLVIAHISSRNVQVTPVEEVCPPHKWSEEEGILTCAHCKYQPSRSENV